jgi:hypothetical protein
VHPQGPSALEETYHRTPSENDSLEQLTKQNSEDLILFGEVSTKELLICLGVCSKGLLVLKSNRDGIGVPRIQDVDDVHVDTSQGLH